MGHIVKVNTARENFNIHGTPYVIYPQPGTTNDEYFYIYFHDDVPENEMESGAIPGSSSSVDDSWGHIAVARAKIGDVIIAAKNGHTSKWEKLYKYDDGYGYDTYWVDALAPLGSSSNILPTKKVGDPSEDSTLATGFIQLNNGRGIAHSDAVYHTDTKKYFLTTNLPKNWRSDPNGDVASGVAFYESCDGVNWQYNSFKLKRSPDFTPVDVNRRKKGGWKYISIIDDDGTDNSQATGPFYLIAPYEVNKEKRVLSGSSYVWQDDGNDVKRVERYTVNVSGCSCP